MLWMSLKMHPAPAVVPNLTSSRTGTFYFAYGSNLSPEQMAGRCVDSPTTSAIPVAVARLDGWRWIICQKGYANIVPSSSTFRAQTESRLADSAQSIPSPNLTQIHDHPEARQESDKEENVVYGLIYNLSSGDEFILDSYEGHTRLRNPDPVPNPCEDADEVRRKPFLQGGEWDYNKLYLDVGLLRWLQPREEYEIGAGMAEKRPREMGDDKRKQKIRALVYVDEVRTGEGEVQPEYVGRMNRAIEQGVNLKIPRVWVERVMRRWIAKGIGLENVDGDFGQVC